MQPEDETERLLRAFIGKLARHTAEGRGRVPLWSVVGDFCGHGSTVSYRICTRYGYDPNTMVVQPEWYDPERTDVRAYCPKHQVSHGMDEVCEKCESEYYAANPDKVPGAFADEPGSVGGI